MIDNDMILVPLCQGTVAMLISCRTEHRGKIGRCVDLILPTDEPRKIGSPQTQTG